MTDADPRSLLELLAALGRDIPVLVQKEIDLAREQVKDALALALASLRRLLIGTALAIAAIGVALAAIVSVLAAFLVWQGVDRPVAGALSSTVVTMAAGLAAWILLAGAARSLKAAKASLDSSVRTLAETLPIVDREQDADR